MLQMEGHIDVSQHSEVLLLFHDVCNGNLSYRYLFFLHTYSWILIQISFTISRITSFNFKAQLFQLVTHRITKYYSVSRSHVHKTLLVWLAMCALLLIHSCHQVSVFQLQQQAIFVNEAPFHMLHLPYFLPLGFSQQNHRWDYLASYALQIWIDDVSH